MYVKVIYTMFLHKLSFGKSKRLREKRIDVVAEQVKQVLTNVDQKLILMVRN